MTMKDIVSMSGLWTRERPERHSHAGAWERAEKMAGLYRKKNEMPNKQLIIRNWIIEVSRDVSWKNYHDLHIDDIEAKYAFKRNWVKGGLEIFDLATKIRDQLNLRLLVALGIELKSSKRQEHSFIDSSLDIGELGNSPPSLYLFDPRWNNWVEMLDKSRPVRNKDLIHNTGSAFYFEYLNPEDSEYRRSIWWYA